MEYPELDNLIRDTPSESLKDWACETCWWRANQRLTAAFMKRVFGQEGNYSSAACHSLCPHTETEQTTINRRSYQRKVSKGGAFKDGRYK